jgi:hypothetical protein
MTKGLLIVCFGLGKALNARYSEGYPCIVGKRKIKYRKKKKIARGPTSVGPAPDPGS